MAYVFSLVCSSLMILFLHGMIYSPRFYKYFRVDSIGFLISLIIIRMLVPLEFKFAKTFYLPPSPAALQPTIEMAVTAWTIGVIPVIWMIGVVIALVLNLFWFFTAKKQMLAIVKTKKTTGRDGKYEIATSNLIWGPFIAGKTIYFPADLNLTDEEYRAVVRHEKAHYENHHYVLKTVLGFLRIVYWWLPVVYLLEKDALIYFELKADFDAAKELSEAEYCHYGQIVVSVQRKCKESHFMSETKNVSPFVKKRSMTVSRIKFFICGKNKPNTNKKVIILFMILMLIPSLVIIKPDILPPGLGTEVFTEDQLTPVEVDGSFYLQFGNERVKIDDRETIRQFFGN